MTVGSNSSNPANAYYDTTTHMGHLLLRRLRLVCNNCNKQRWFQWKWHFRSSTNLPQKQHHPRPLWLGSSGKPLRQPATTNVSVWGLGVLEVVVLRLCLMDEVFSSTHAAPLSETQAHAYSYSNDSPFLSTASIIIEIRFRWNQPKERPQAPTAWPSQIRWTTRHASSRMKIWMASHLHIIRTRPASSNPYTLCHPKRYGQRAFLSAPAAAWYWLLRPSQNPAPWERWSLETMKGSTSPQKLSAEFLALPQLQNKCVVKKTFRVPKSIICIIGMHDIKSTTDHRFNHCYLSWKKQT